MDSCRDEIKLIDIMERLNDLQARDSACVDGILKFLQRTACWNQEHEMWHVRQLCIEEAVRGIDARNAPDAMRFGKLCCCEVLYSAALQKICQCFEEVVELSDGFLDLDLVHILAIIKHPHITVQSEEHLVSALLNWVENSPYTEVHKDLKVKSELEAEIANIEASLDGMRTAASTLRDDVAKFDEEVNFVQRQAEESLRSLQTSDVATRQLRVDLMESTQAMESSIRELGGMKTEQLFKLYKNPRTSVQKLFEALAVMLGLEKYWKSTQKMCADGSLVFTMMQFDIHKVQVDGIRGVYAMLELSALDENEFTSKGAKLICRWIRSASTCVRLVSQIEAQEKQSHMLETVYEEHRTIASASANDMSSLKASSRNANSVWMMAEKNLFMHELRLKLCIQRLIRTASRIDFCVREIFSVIKWNLVTKDFIVSKVCADNFVANFILCNDANASSLRAAWDIPEASFLHSVGSQGMPVMWAQRNGRNLRGCGSRWDEILLSKRAQLSRRKVGFMWSRTMYIPELKAEGYLASVGCTSRGSLVAISGDYMYVAGGLDQNRDALAKVFRVCLTPASKFMMKDEWIQIAFLSSARAFCYGGIMISSRQWKKRHSPLSSPRGISSPKRHPERLNSENFLGSCCSPRKADIPSSPDRDGSFQPKECFFVSGGYSADDKWLRTVEVLELPWADHWKRIHVQDKARALATAVIVQDAMIAVGGFDQYSNNVRFCERVDVPLGFDAIGELRVFQ